MSGYAQGGHHDQYDDAYSQQGQPYSNNANPNASSNASQQQQGDYYQDQAYYDQQDYSQHGDGYYDRCVSYSYPHPLILYS